MCTVISICVACCMLHYNARHSPKCTKGHNWCISQEYCSTLPLTLFVNVPPLCARTKKYIQCQLSRCIHKSNELKCVFNVFSSMLIMCIWYLHGLVWGEWERGSGALPNCSQERLANKIFIMRLTCRMRDVLFFLWHARCVLSGFLVSPALWCLHIITLSRSNPLCTCVLVCVCLFKQTSANSA